MRNFWLDRIRKREEASAKKKTQFIFPRHLWQFLQQCLRHKKGP